MKRLFLALLAAVGAFALTTSGFAADLSDRLDEAAAIVNDRQSSDHPIPQAVLRNCKGIAVVKVTEAGLVVGGQGGQGVLLKRDGMGWSAPCCFNVSGGTFGAQIGAQTKRLIFVINSDSAWRCFTSESGVKWNGTAAGTVGGDSAHESASQLQNEALVVYADHDGVFGGATVGGTTFTVDRDANRAAYGQGVTTHDILHSKVKSPKDASPLFDALKK